jgi:hypothetical protein
MKYHTIKTYGGVEVQLHHSDLGIRLRPRYPLARRLGGPQSRSGRDGEQKNLMPFPGVEPRASSSQPVAVQTRLTGKAVNATAE